jgi:tetratricopeptide (TPR) repeat protein
VLGGLHPNGYHKDNANNAVYSSDGIKLCEVDANTWYKRGNTNHRWQRYDEALKCYDKAIEMNPNFVKAWENKGVAFYRLRKYEEAIKCYDKIIVMNPNYPKPWIMKGQIHEWADGLRMIEEYPNHEKIGGLMYINPNYVSRAYIKYYDKAIEINSKYENNAVDVWLELYFALTYRLESLSILCGIYAIPYRLSELYSELYGTDREKERLEKALYCITKALECKSTYAYNPSIWETKGHLLFYLARYEEALKSYEKALEIEPDYYSIGISRYGAVLKELGRDEDARKFFDHLQYMEEKYGPITQFDGGTLLECIVNEFW